MEKRLSTNPYLEYLDWIHLADEKAYDVLTGTLEVNYPKGCDFVGSCKLCPITTKNLTCYIQSTSEYYNEIYDQLKQHYPERLI